MGSQPVLQPVTAPQILRIFISYASEDSSIAHAIARAIGDALPDGFAEVCFDKWFLELGVEFKKQIESKLEKTDYLIIVYTGVEKESHGFTGFEVGYCEKVRKDKPDLRIVPLYVENLPPTATEFEGVSLKIPVDLLQLDVAEFTTRDDIAEDDPLCKLIEELQKRAGKLLEDAHYPAGSWRDKCKPLACVRSMRQAVFNYLKTQVEMVIAPQKQLIIESTGAALRNCQGDLPGDAKLKPQSGGPMNIFGLGVDKEITWQRFLQLTEGPHRDSWRQAITSVITSSLAERIDVDNSQIVVSSDGSKAYRIVLSTATKYWDDRQEFSLYFVETLRREEYGDKDTTSMLKGLDLACRYRFMFLEPSSEFSANNLLATREDRLPDLAARLLRELNLIRQELNTAGVDQPVVWAPFLGWDLIRVLTEETRSKEQMVRDLIGKVLNAKEHTEKLTALRRDLAKAIGELEDTTRSQNALVIEKIAAKLIDSVKPAPAPQPVSG